MSKPSVHILGIKDSWVLFLELGTKLDWVQQMEIKGRDKTLTLVSPTYFLNWEQDWIGTNKWEPRAKLNEAT